MTQSKPNPWALAHNLNALGYTVVPIRPGEKRPAFANWQHAAKHQKSLLQSDDIYEGFGVGILTAGLAAIDIDVKDKAMARRMRDFVIEVTGTTHVPIRVGQPPKMLMVYRRAEGASPKMASGFWQGGSDEQEHRVEVLGEGQQFVAYGLHPDTNRPYMWRAFGLADVEMRVEDLPEVSTEQLEQILAKFDEMAEAAGWALKGAGSSGNGSDSAPPMPVAGVDFTVARQILEHYDNEDLHYDDWLAVGMALHHQFSGYTEAFDLWNDWSAASSKDRGEGVNWRHWQSFSYERPGGLSLRTIMQRAEQNGWQRPARVEGAPAAAADFPELDDVDVPPVPVQEDVAAADEFPALEEPPPEPPVRKGRGAPWTITPDFDLAAIPARDWILPGVLMRGHVTGLAAPPGVSKSLFELARAASVATGRSLLGEAVAQQGNVLLINNEDDTEELRRRVGGLMVQHGLRPEDLQGRLFIWSGYGDPVRVAVKTDRNMPLQRAKGVSKGLIPFLRRHNIVALFADPLISTAQGAEENDNNDMDDLVSIWKGIAGEARVAVSLTHHTRKGGNDTEAHAGDAQAFRGGGAFIGAVRLAHTVARMSNATANQLGIPPEEARRLVRADNAKSNYHLPDGKAAWFRLESIQLPSGDSVGVPVPADIEEIADAAMDAADEPVLTEEQLHRSRIIHCFEAEIFDADGYLSLTMLQVSERYIGEVQRSQRWAMDHLKQYIPEGGFHRAVVVPYGSRNYLLWREVVGGGRGARHMIHMAYEGITPDRREEDWEDE